MNLISRNSWGPEIKSTNDRIVPFTHFECPAFTLTNHKPHNENYLKQLQNTIPFTITVTTIPLTHNLNVAGLEHYCSSGTGL